MRRVIAYAKIRLHAIIHTITTQIHATVNVGHMTVIQVSTSTMRAVAANVKSTKPVMTISISTTPHASVYVRM